MVELNKIYNMDCLDLLKQCDAESFDLVFADPPFNQEVNYGQYYKDSKPLHEYLEWCEMWIQESARVLKPDGNMFLMNNQMNIGYMKVILDKYLAFKNFIIWPGTNPNYVPFYLIRTWTGILFYAKDYKNSYVNVLKQKHTSVTSSQMGGVMLGDIWDDVSRITKHKAETIVGEGINKKKINQNYKHTEDYVEKEGLGRRKANTHYCQMPVTLGTRVLDVGCKEGGSVLDLFCGTGSFIMAAIAVGRSWVGCELNPNYVKVIEDRIAKEKKWVTIV